MTERMESLRERVARQMFFGTRVEDDGADPGDYWRARADEALAALGLLDLDAAATRLWDALALVGAAADRGSMEYDEGTDSSVVAANRAMHRAALEAALTATGETHLPETGEQSSQGDPIRRQHEWLERIAPDPARSSHESIRSSDG